VRRSVVSVALAFGAVVIGGVLGSYDGPRPTVSDLPTPITSLSTFEVHVAGWVVAPGVVTVADGAIVAEAIAAAGGLRLGARSELVNLAAPVQSGEQIRIPGPEDVAAGDDDEGPIRLNTASAKDLESLPGVGPVLARRIEEFREANGPFRQVEDLLQVSGVGEAKLASIRDLVQVP